MYGNTPQVYDQSQTALYSQPQPMYGSNATSNAANVHATSAYLPAGPNDHYN